MLKPLWCGGVGNNDLLMSDETSFDDLAFHKASIYLNSFRNNKASWCSKTSLFHFEFNCKEGCLGNPVIHIRMRVVSEYFHLNRMPDW